MTEQQAWLALLRTPRLSTALALALVERFGTATAALNAGASAWRQSGATPAVIEGLQTPDHDGVALDQAWLEAAPDDHHFIPWTDARYPAVLRQIECPPLGLFVNGDPDVLSVPQLAVVGSRNPTSGGRQTAREFSRHLAARGLTVTSGLALGVDAAAHEGALEADGLTIAVTATGPDRVYPARNRSLAHRVTRAGTVVTEFPCGTPARPGHFPRRNRIISGLATGTLVVEASPRSGSLITARCALEQGREVFAIPGSIHNPLARGCHLLIREGSAKLVEQADEILEEIPAMLTPLSGTQPAGGSPGDATGEHDLDDEHRRVLDAVGHDPVPLETVLQRTALTPDVVSSILLLLELSGRIEAMPGGRYARAGRNE